MAIQKTEQASILKTNLPTFSASGLRAQANAMGQLSQAADKITGQLMNELYEEMELKGQLDGSDNVVIDPKTGETTLKNPDIPDAGTVYSDAYRKSLFTSYEAGLLNNLSNKSKELEQKYQYNSAGYLEEFNAYTQAQLESAPDDIKEGLYKQSVFIGNAAKTNIDAAIQRKASIDALNNLNQARFDLTERAKLLIHNGADENNEELSLLLSQINSIDNSMSSNPNVDRAKLEDLITNTKRSFVEIKYIGQSNRLSREKNGIANVYKLSDELRNNPDPVLGVERSQALAAKMDGIAGQYQDKIRSIHNEQIFQQKIEHANNWIEALNQYGDNPVKLANYIDQNPDKFDPSTVAKSEGFLLNSYENLANNAILDGDFTAASNALMKAYNVSGGANFSTWNKYLDIEEKINKKLLDIGNIEAKSNAKILAHNGQLKLSNKELLKIGFSDKEIIKLNETNSAARAKNTLSMQEQNKVINALNKGIPILDDNLAKKLDPNIYDLSNPNDVANAIINAKRLGRLPVDVSNTLKDTLSGGDKQAVLDAVSLYNELKINSENEFEFKKILINSLSEKKAASFINFMEKEFNTIKDDDELVTRFHKSYELDNASGQRRESVTGLKEEEMIDMAKNILTKPEKFFKGLHKTAALKLLFGDIYFKNPFTITKQARQAEIVAQQLRDNARLYSVENIEIDENLLKRFVRNATSKISTGKYTDFEAALKAVYIENQFKTGFEKMPDGTVEFKEYPISYWGNIPTGSELYARPNIKLTYEDFAEDAIIKYNEQLKAISPDGEIFNDKYNKYDLFRDLDPKNVRFEPITNQVPEGDTPTYRVTYIKDGQKIELFSRYKFNWDHSIARRRFMAAAKEKDAGDDIMSSLSFGLFKVSPISSFYKKRKKREDMAEYFIKSNTYWNNVREFFGYPKVPLNKQKMKIIEKYLGPLAVPLLNGSDDINMPEKLKELVDADKRVNK